MELVKQKVFQYLVLWHPTKEESKTTKSKIIVEPKLVLANDEKSVGMTAVKAIPAEFDNQLDQIEIVVKAF